MISIARALRAYRRNKLGEQDGFTLIELLVTMALFGVLTTVLFSIVLNSANTLRSMRQTTDLNEESRVVLNRMSRELREAQSLVAAENPGGTTYDPTVTTSVTFEVDFNGNNIIEPNASDPERITYRYEPATKRILLQAAGITYPILAANVESFKLTYGSKRYECDSNSDGFITWEELDSAPPPCPTSIGNSNGILDAELAGINSVTIEFTVLTGSRRQEYRTQLDMRNRAF